MKKVLLLFVILIALGAQVYAQNREIKGRVLDENGQGFPGAGITVQGTQTGTVTDVNGNFSLEVPANTSPVLVIQALGYTSQEVAATGGMVTVRLASTAKELQGAVVTALGIKREKRELGYNSTTVSNEDLTAGNNTSALSSLQGKVAGANITSSTGGPGGSTRIVLRGEKSISGNNNALIVVDGVITNNYDRTQLDQLTQVDFGNSANEIDPDDIESVTVLPGPAAAALYGSEGANGAVMITTKSGKNRSTNKKLEVTYKATYTESDILKYPDLQHQYGQGNIYNGIADDTRENFSWGEPFSMYNGALRPWGQVINGQQLTKPYVDQPNNIKSFFNKGKDMNNYVSLAGGDEKTSYFMSISALNSTGVIPNTFYNKYSIRFNGSTQLSNHFYSTINVNYMNNSSRVAAQGQSVGSVFDNLFETARDIPVWEEKNYNNPNDPKSVFFSMGSLDANGVAHYGNYGAYYKNPYWINDNYDNRDKTDRLLGDVTVGYRNGKFDIFDRPGIDVSADRQFFKSPAYNYQPYDPFYGGDNFVSAGGYSESDLNELQFNNDLIAQYTTDLSKDIGLTLLAGNNIRYYQVESLSGDIDPTTSGLVIPGFYNFQNAQGPIIVGNSTIQQATVGAYGDFKLNYKKSLFLEMTGRNDWSSTLSPGFRSYFYPSVNASWVFTENMHGRFKDNILNYGKIFGGYSSVGNSAPVYVSNNNQGFNQTTVGTAFGSVLFPFNSVPGFQSATLIGDSTLRPERTNEYEIGTNLSLFKDILNVSFTYYNDLTIDQITSVPIPYSTGYAFREVNLGNVKNSGEEVTVRVTPIHSKTGFRWDIYGTYTHNVNDVLSLTNGLSQITIGGFEGMAIAAAVGHPVGSFYSIDYARDPQGHVIVDQFGLPVSSTKASFQGTYQPRFIASWGTDLSYKGFSLHVLFTTKQGGIFYSRDKGDLDFNGTSAETANRSPQLWPNSVQAVTGANGAVTYVPNTTKYSPYSYYTVTEQAVASSDLVDASYVKLQEAAIYYTIPQRLYKRSPFGSLQVGVFGNNLLIWTAKSNQFDDPEETSAGATSNGQGFNFTALPSLRNYGVSLKVVF